MVSEELKNKVLDMYPELEGALTDDFFEVSMNLSALKKFLKSTGMSGAAIKTGMVTHVGKVEGGVLMGITTRGFGSPEAAECAYESAQKMHKRPVLLIF